MPKTKILILGSASWLGSLIIPKLHDNDFEISATCYNHIIDFSNPIKHYKAKTLKDYQSILNVGQFDVIINFLRGENKEGYDIHQSIISYCKNNPTQYVFCSSALALESYNNQVLTEDKAAMAESEYGLFKANCEKMLYDSGIDWSVLRFSSLQGHCKHKTVRNEHFLKQLNKGITISVDQKVIQNRMFADDAIDIILKIVEEKHTGIFHLGTIDASDEIDFLKKQAQLFGYGQNLVKSSTNIRNVNLNCIPNRIHQLFPATRFFTEEDTLQKVFQVKALKKYYTVDVV